MCLAFPVNRFLPRPPGPVPKRRLEIQQSQAVWELNNQHPDAEIRRDRTAIQTAGAVSRGPEQQNVEKEAFHTRPGPRPLPWPPPPTPPRSARSPHRTAASHQLRRPPGVPPGFLVCGQRSAERVTSRKDKSPAARTRRLASSGPRPARPRLCRRHVPGRARSLGAAPSPGCAGPPRGGVGEPRDLDSGVHISAAPVTREPRAVATPVTQEPASLLRPRPFPGRRGASRSAESQLAVGGVLSPH